MHALERQIREANELRERLALMHGMLLKGGSPSMDDWVRTLSMMTTFGRYFEAGELKRILGAYPAIEQEWLVLQAEVRRYMDAGGAIDTFEGRAHAPLDGPDGAVDGRRLRADGALGRDVPARARRARPRRRAGGRPDGVHGTRHQAARGVDAGPLRRGELPRAGLERRGSAGDRGRRPALLRAGEPADGARARALRARWMALLEQSSGGDAALRDKLATLHKAHPLLMAGLPLGRAVREFLSTVPEKT
ncbi:hypothetical protein HK414_01445 [Ramlibacter terrae]|uniref:Uncharacterized protein n=1 Tax=Ramlibacter terrae TaxID=2732511 RepID=A0ABX6NZY0_9BURK|nr:hypothetical protein HK414_01445 [Ramlibacter terrae]